MGAGVTEAEEEQVEETAETSEVAGRARRAVLLGLLGVGDSARTRRLVMSPSGTADAAFRCRLLAPVFGLVRDAGASQRFWGGSSSGSRKVGRAVDSESGKRSEEAEMCKLVGEGWRRRAVLCSWTDVGFNFYELRWV